MEKDVCIFTKGMIVSSLMKSLKLDSRAGVTIENFVVGKFGELDLNNYDDIKPYLEKLTARQLSELFENINNY